MNKIQSTPRRSLVIAGAAGMAAVAAPQVLKTRLAQSLATPAAAQAIPPKTGEVKVQYTHRTGKWGIGGWGYNTIPLEIYNQFGHGTTPVVHEVQLHFRLDHPEVTALRVELISPDGHTETLLNSSSFGGLYCSRKGIDITLVDTEQPNCCASFNTESYKYCPEYNATGADKLHRTWERKVLKGTFHTWRAPESRTLPRFNRKPAVGTWYLRVHNGLNKAVNKVIRQIDLTVYSKW